MGRYTITAKVYDDNAKEGDARVSNFENVAHYDNEEEALRGLRRLSDPTYEGWPNRETWCVNLWLNNDQPLWESARALCRDGQPTTYEAERQLSDFVEGLALNLNMDESAPAGLGTDLIMGALARVEWRPIVEGFRED